MKRETCLTIMLLKKLKYDGKPLETNSCYVTSFPADLKLYTTIISNDVISHTNATGT